MIKRFKRSFQGNVDHIITVIISAKAREADRRVLQLYEDEEIAAAIRGSGILELTA